MAMAVGDTLPTSTSFHVHHPSLPHPKCPSSSSSSSPPPSILRRCCSMLARLSPCLFIASLLFFFLMVQFDLVPQVDSPQIRVFLQKLRSLPLPSTYSSSSSSSSSSSPSPSSSPPPPLSYIPSSAPGKAHPSPPHNSEVANSTDSPSESTNPAANPTGRIAICIVGGVREFELTGPSMKEYLLQSFANADVFVHAPFDKDSYKLSILKDIPNLVHFRIFKPETISEPRTYTDILTASNSPHGIQGLLQYFNLVEGCAHMISEYQLQHKFEYKWIIRTRFDGYWNGYLPPLDEMDEKAYTVPVGSQFGGLNDRLGIGNWKTSEVALSRLSLLPLIHANGAKGLNSESSFKQQLIVREVSYKLRDFPFCILSRRKYGWPPGRRGVPVASMFNRGHLNGAKCRPCHPVSNGGAAKSILEGLDRGWSWPGNVDDIELCNPTGDWEPQWQDLYDTLAGPERAMVRVILTHQNSTECIQENEALRKQVQVWDAPTPAMICERALRT